MERRRRALSCVSAVLLTSVVLTSASPRAQVPFVRSAAETVPKHDTIAAPIRASVESVPLRYIEEEGERIPLRDAVEKRPDPLGEEETVVLRSHEGQQDSQSIPNKEDNGDKKYYGAATHLNRDKSNERLQQGNANLQEMQQTSSEGVSRRRLVVCYMQSWAAYRAPPLAFTAGLIPASCTHLHYAFAKLHPHTYAVTSANEDYDIVKGGYRIATGLKKRLPGLRVMLSVGGDGSERLFSEMVQSPLYRRSFVDSAVTFVMEHGFDGVDLHWKYAGDQNERDREQFTSLLYELRERLSPHGLLLSTVLPPFRYAIEDGYEMTSVSGATDYAVLQAWDMTHGRMDEPPRRALQHSALHRDPGAAGRDRPYDNIEYITKYIIRHGMAPDKLVLGIPLYGRSYTLASPTVPMPGAVTDGWGDEGQYTQTKGMLSYFEICMGLQEGKGTSGTDEAGNTYATFDNQWISYDTPQTVAEKMKFVISSGLAGAAAWAVDMDDFRGLCGPTFPIVRTMAAALNYDSLDGEQSSLKLGSCEARSPYLASDENSCAHFQFCSGRTNYRLQCEEDRLYDPSTGFCGHQDPSKCMPGQNLRISVQEASRLLPQAYETDFEWSDGVSDSMNSKIFEELVSSEYSAKKKFDSRYFRQKAWRENNAPSQNKPILETKNLTINKFFFINIFLNKSDVPYDNFSNMFKSNQVFKNINRFKMLANNNLNNDSNINYIKNKNNNEFDQFIYNDFGEVIYHTNPHNDEDVNINTNYDKDNQIISNNNPNHNIPYTDNINNDDISSSNSITYNQFGEVNFDSENLQTENINMFEQSTETFVTPNINAILLNVNTTPVENSHDGNINAAISVTETTSENINTPHINDVIYNEFGEVIYDTNNKNNYSSSNVEYLDESIIINNTSNITTNKPTYFTTEHQNNVNTPNTGILYLQDNLNQTNIYTSSTVDPIDKNNITYNEYGEIVPTTQNKPQVSVVNINDNYNNSYEHVTESIIAPTIETYHDEEIDTNGFVNVNQPDSELPDSNLIINSSDKDNDKRVICYMTSWAFYRRGEGKFVPEHIDTRLCTHVVYAYASLVPDDLVAKEYDPWADINNNLYERVTSLKDVRVMLGIGGWTDSAGDKYSRLVSSTKARANFIEKLITFLRMHNFQGLHFDWNYPVCWQSNCKKGAKSDKTNFAIFVQELSKALHGAGMELGIAISGYKEVIESGYDFSALSNAADFLTAMTYDYHGGWERVTGHHTPLVPLPKESLSHYSIEYAIRAMISGGADPKKINLGLAFYGQSFRLTDADGKKGPGSPTSGPGEPGEFTKQPGMLAYYEICYRVKNLRWKVGRQTNAGPYAYQDTQWVGYDDPESITEKVKWAMRQGLGGVTAWAIDLDDYNNRCCAEAFPLLRAAGRAVGHDTPPPPASACERPPQPVTPAPPTTTTIESDGSIVGSGGNHDHHGGHQTSTTWPSWTPPVTQATTQTWRPPAATTTTTTTTTMRPTRPTTNAPANTPSKVTDGVEDAKCKPGDYHEAHDDCESYLQCVGGRWKKNQCANGLHWNKEGNRCDWPSFAKCTVRKPSGGETPTTTTLAPITTRPPPTTTTTKATTTTRKPTTTTTTTPSTTSENLEHGSCSGYSYQPAPNNCNAYLHCDGSMWIMQSCAPGLHWSSTDNHCDWPKYAKCEESSIKPSTTASTHAPKPTRPSSTAASSVQKQEGKPCGSGDSLASSNDCESYLQCVSGKWTRQRCPPGLHWDKRTMRCDWAEYAMCEAVAMKIPSTTKRPSPATSTGSSESGLLRPGTHCRTGTYHAHPRCNKFYVCVNSNLVSQSCAPGLVWRPDRSQCDFPSASSCTDRREGPSHTVHDTPNLSAPLVQATNCENGQYTTHPDDCSRYQLCIFGKFEVYSCSPGLHWNKDKQTCDWPKNAKCKTKMSVPTASNTKPTLGGPQKPPSVEETPASTETNTAIATTLPVVDSSPNAMNDEYKLVCYFTNWAWYRPGIGQYVPEDIDPSLCTHIVYGFAVLGYDGLMTAHDSWADYENKFYERVVAFKKHGIKVSLAIGGWNDSAGDKYSKLVNNPSARRKFVDHAVEFLEKYNFDGLDLDWEYPKCWQVDCSKGPDSDKEGFSALVRELSEAFKPKGFLLSSAVSPNKKVIDAGYDVPVLAKHMDWIAVMTYDYHGQWDKKTGHVAPLYYHPDDDNTYFNANYTMHYWIKKGAPPSKLVMGIPLYGQSFTTGVQWDTPPELLKRKNATGLNVPARTGGQAGEFTRAKGFLAYYEICDRIKNHGWTVEKDTRGRMGPFAYKGDQWVSFDDVNIIKKKVNFIKSLNLAGGMVWALDLDDFKNRCGQGKHPLLNTIKNGLLGETPTHLIPVVEPPKVEDDNDIVVTPAVDKKPTTPHPHKQTPRPSSGSRPQAVVASTTETNDILVPGNEKYKVVCYYTNWAWYRPGSGKYSPADIDASLCTHIIYAFAVLDNTRLVINPHDSWTDIDNKFYEKVVAFKSRGIKVLIGLGGWNDSAGDKYSRLVNSPSSRRTFIVHAIDFIQQYGFDGLDLDWEYPKCWQVECEKGPASDKQGFANLVRELRTAFSPKGLLLSAAVSPSKRVIDAGYDVKGLSQNLDWIAIMAYDYHGQWDKKTGHVAPMYAREEDDDKTFNANFTVNYWIQKGAARRKLVMGIPLYGQSFSLSENSGTGLGAPAYAGGAAGDETRARGFLAFYEICERIRVEGWKVVKDAGGRIGPYATLGDQWVSFDDDFMIRHKAEYVRAMGLGGGMVWSMDLDDFTGRYCGCGKSPLLTNINHVLRNKHAPPPCQLQEIRAPEETTVPMTPDTSVAVTEAPEEDYEPSKMDAHLNEQNNDGSVAGSPCKGVVFRGDPVECGTYYLCNNGRYVQLKCPKPLHWNENHCDWPSKAQCNHKALIRLTGEEEDVTEKPILACYFTNWAYYRSNGGKFGPEQIDPSLCTHIIYAWAHLDEKTFKIVSGNPELDLENNFYGKISEIRLSGVKVILGVGGIEDSAHAKWEQMVAGDHNRTTFVSSVVSYMERWGFDGLHLSWQYPICSQAPCSVEKKDQDNLNSLLLQISKELRPRNLEFSVAVPDRVELAEVFDPKVLAGAADWVSTVANDYHTGPSHNTAYLWSQNLEHNNSFISSLEYWLESIPGRQLVAGIPAFARTYTLRDSHSTAPGAKAVGPGAPGSYTGVAGFLAYYEVCSGIVEKDWIEYKTTEGTFAVSGDQWATYIDPEQVQRMVSWASSKGVRGASLWALDLDDWSGRCKCGAYPMLQVIRQTFLDPDLPAQICIRKA